MNILPNSKLKAILKSPVVPKKTSDGGMGNCLKEKEKKEKIWGVRRMGIYHSACSLVFLFLLLWWSRALFCLCASLLSCHSGRDGIGMDVIFLLLPPHFFFLEIIDIPRCGFVRLFVAVELRAGNVGRCLACDG